MGRKTQIAILALVALLLLGVAVGYAYDSSQKDKIADGVTRRRRRRRRHGRSRSQAGGQPPAARAAADTRCGSATTARAGSCAGKSLKVHADLDAAVEEALAESRDGGFPGRLVRYVTGGDLDKQIPADVTYSKPAINRFVRKVAERGRTRSRRTPRSNRAPTRSKSWPAKNGRKLRDNLLTRQLEAAVLNADADHTIAARTHCDEAGSDRRRKSPPRTRPT